MLFVCGVTRKGRQRVIAFLVLVVYLWVPILLLWNYSLVRDHVRWFFLSRGYQAKVLAQAPNEQLRHVDWDGWGLFVGAATLSPLQCERRERHERRTLGRHRIDRGRSAGTDLSPFQLHQRVARGEDRIAGAVGTAQGKRGRPGLARCRRHRGRRGAAADWRAQTLN